MADVARPLADRARSVSFTFAEMHLARPRRAARPGRRRRRRRSPARTGRAARRRRSAAPAGNRRARRWRAPAATACSSSAISPVMVESGVTAASICAMSMRSVPAEAAHQLLHLVLGGVDARVAGLSATRRRSPSSTRWRRRAPPRCAPSMLAAAARVAEREHEQRQERELHEEREEALQLREEARRFLVAQDALPDARRKGRAPGAAAASGCRGPRSPRRRARRSAMKRAGGKAVKCTRAPQLRNPPRRNTRRIELVEGNVRRRRGT